MIDTRSTIFNSILKLFRRLFKLADLNPSGFKAVMYAVILNDLKEWEEYMGEPHPKAEEILKKFLQNSPHFNIVRLQLDLLSYMNVNTPLNNDTWKRIWDKEGLLIYTPVINSENGLNYSIWYGDGLTMTKKSFTKIFTLNANTKTIVIKTDRPNTTLVKAVNSAFELDNMTEDFIQTSESELTVFTLKLRTPLNEQIKILLN